MLKDVEGALQQIVAPPEGEQDAEMGHFTRQLREELAPTDGSFDTFAALTSEIAAIETGIELAKKTVEETKVKLEALWADESDNDYELSSVFIHLGAAGYGHYYRASTGCS